MLDAKRDEEERTKYELEYGYDKARELERYKKAVEMCIAGGFLRKEKFDEALAYVQEFHG